MSSTHPVTMVLDVRHPRPKPATAGRRRPQGGHGRYCMSRAVQALRDEGEDGYTLGLTAEEVGLRLGLPTHFAERLCWSAWMGGLLVFDIIDTDIVYRLIRPAA